MLGSPSKSRRSLSKEVARKHWGWMISARNKEKVHSKILGPLLRS